MEGTTENIVEVPNLRDLVTPEAVCDEYGISRRTLTNWVAQGMPAYRFGPRRLRFDEAAVRAWVIRSRCFAQAEPAA